MATFAPVGSLFNPSIPQTFQELGVPESLVLNLALRRLLMEGSSSLTGLSRSLRISIAVVDLVFKHMRAQHLVEIKRMTGNDHNFTLSGAGKQLAGERFNVSQLQAPMQMKANNGILIIDDFGRQLMSPRDLLNRWIVPLDRRVDYLTLRYDVKFQIPFELMVVFSTNLEPSDLADEAFLRRIHNKIFVDAVDPSSFDQIFVRTVQSRGLQAEPDSAEYLRKLCLREGGTELRASYPGDICTILESIGRYEGRPPIMTKPESERATSLYFAKN